MIVLHPSLSDDLVEFTDVQSITSRQRYATDVDPRKVSLVKPVGVYRFKDKILCGLKSCHTPHNKGLVALTSEGTEVNIGHICGRHHFGEQFTVFLRTATRYEQRKFHVEAVRSLKAEAGRHTAHMQALMEAPKGAAWCSRAVRKFRDALPWDAVDALVEMARRGESKVYEEVDVEGEAAELLRHFGARGSLGGAGSSRVSREFRGLLHGLEVFTNDPGKLLYDLQTELSAFMSVDPLSCKPKELKIASDFASQFASRLQRVEELISGGTRFFQVETFERLCYLPRIQQTSRSMLQSFAWDYDKGIPRPSKAA